MAIYVGNLSYTLKESDLENLFSEFGNVTSVKIVKDRDTGNSKGFAFVELDSDKDEDNAVSQLDGREVKGRNLRVNKARPKDESR